MTLTLVFLVTLSVAAAANAEENTLRPAIRTSDSRLRQLVDDGVRLSPTFRALVERLAHSDVVVYLRCDGAAAPGVDGRLTFVASNAGLRYVVVRLQPALSRVRLLALLGHELKHAVEIADTPSIVDSASLLREYQQIGYVNPLATPGVAFDSRAAVEAGKDVLRELPPSREALRRASPEHCGGGSAATAD